MDSLIAIGAGLGLRGLIYTVAHDTVQTTALVGLWEGVVLNHFQGKSPSSIDPYLAFAFRLFIDFMLTENFTRLTVIILWTGLGMLLADVAVQMSADRRFRRLWRKLTRRFSLSSSPVYHRSPSSRVRFFEIPGSSSTAGSRTTTAISPDNLRPTTTPVPGQFDQWSVISDPARLPASPVPSESISTSRTSYSGHLREPTRSRTPSELEYLTLPVIPDAAEPSVPVAGPSSRPHIQVDVTPRRSYPTKRDEPYERDDKPAVKSGLTTPTSNPRSPFADEEDRPRVHSGLTTPEYLSRPLQPPVPEIPVIGKKGIKPAASQPAAVRLTLAEPSPTVTFPEPQLVPPAVAFPEPQLTPMAIPPTSEIPNIPTPKDDPLLGPRTSLTRTPPPSFQEAIKAADIEDDVSSVGESVIRGKRNEIIAKADELRQQAKDREAERDRLRGEIRKAEKEKRYYDVVCLQVELEETQENINQLHAKAARRYYKAHNLNPAPQEIDVHRLGVEEAYAQVRKAIRDARGFGASQLRIIVGKGNHSKDKAPVLKPAIMNELKQLHIDATQDPKNAGVLVVKLPAGSFIASKPSV